MARARRTARAAGQTADTAARDARQPGAVPQADGHATVSDPPVCVQRRGTRRARSRGGHHYLAGAHTQRPQTPPLPPPRTHARTHGKSWRRTPRGSPWRARGAPPEAVELPTHTWIWFPPPKADAMTRCTPEASSGRCFGSFAAPPLVPPRASRPPSRHVHEPFVTREFVGVDYEAAFTGR